MATTKIKATVINLEQEVPKSGGSPWLMISEKAAAAAMSSERPGLVAGSAQSLVGPKVSAGPAVSLAAPATGAAILDTIKGNTIVESDTLVSLRISGLVSKDADDAELATISLPIVGKTATDGNGNPIVPYPMGMNGTPTLYDVARKADGEVRFGIVDLGDLSWESLSTDTEGKKRFGCVLSAPAKYVSASSIQAIICPRYTAASNEDTYAASLYDKIVATRSNGGLLILDSAYTDAATFKAAMAGVKLVYELATPVPFTWDEPLEMIAPVEAGGALFLQPEGVDEQGIPATAPLSADIKWPVNAVSADTLTNLLDALKAAGVITAYTMTWDAAAGAYTFTIS